MPDYGVIACRNAGSYAPIMRGSGDLGSGSAFPQGSFGGSNDLPILFLNFADGITRAISFLTGSPQIIGGYPTGANTPQIFNVGGWSGAYAVNISQLTAVDLRGWTWPNFDTSPYPGLLVGLAQLLGTPVLIDDAVALMFWQDIFGPSGNAAVWSPSLGFVERTVWPGPDLANTQEACPSWIDPKRGITTFLQDGIPSGRPSLAIRDRDGNTTYSYLAFDTQQAFDVFFAANSRVAQDSFVEVNVVPEGFLYLLYPTTTAQAFLLAGDGSYYRYITPVPGDDVARQMIGGDFSSDESGGGVFLGNNRFYFFQSFTFPIPAQVLIGELVPGSQSLYARSVGCWPCHPTAQGTR